MSRVIPQGDLTALNTLRLPSHARWLAEVDSVADLVALLRDPRYAGVKRRILGGGSNLLFSAEQIDGLVIRLLTDGWRVASQNGPEVIVSAEAGMNWHRLVSECVDAGFGGIENLALIPGTVGAAPVQNIGAYGVEIADRIERIEAVELATGNAVSFCAESCGFGYRDSLFRRSADTFAIVRVFLRLATDAPLALDYRDLRESLDSAGIGAPTRRQVFEHVCAIRRRKLPDPERIGNAGSFFKNPVVDAAEYQRLQGCFPGIVGYPQADGQVKLAAAWLIDRAGWKGYREGPVGVHEQQALVLVNTGDACGLDVIRLANRIAGDIQRRYGVVLEMEPVVWF